MKYIKDGLIVVILLLLLFFAGKWYFDNTKYNNMENKYKTEIHKQDSLIQNYNDSIVRLDSISTNLTNNINKKDSVIEKQKGSLIHIKWKYGKLKNDIEKATADENVNYLAKRLKDVDSTHISKTPYLTKIGDDTLCSVDVAQVKIINKTFIELDEVCEELDTTKSIVEKQDSLIIDYKELVETKDDIIDLKDSVITSNEAKVVLGDDEQKRLKKEVRKQKIQKVVSIVGGAAVAVLLIIFL